MKTTIYKSFRNQQGFVAFTSLLIISAVTLAIAASVSLLGVNEARNSLDSKRSVETLKIADACTEEALYRLKISQNYSGGVLLVGDGQCSISVSGTAEDKTITITAQITSVSNYFKRLEIVVRRREGGIVVRSWRQI